MWKLYEIHLSVFQSVLEYSYTLVSVLATNPSELHWESWVLTAQTMFMAL